MVILMKTTRRGSPDGSSVRDYEEGSKHDLSHTPREVELAQLFVREGWAQELKEGVAESAPPAPSKAEPPPSSPAAEAPPIEPPSPPPAPPPAPAAKGKQRR